ncbi:hypothetical protein EMCG_06962 [[Emmonsia] crescens]|uniref:CCHC-type domain-containing protein n=1 Tax=[Emmonsia] crescens TaxID=73230 RepID=A0A0G2I9Y2_9EURO|nr:hypothetical protein EMCG_06962 [Emmonsia crescens UAMH 3008]
MIPNVYSAVPQPDKDTASVRTLRRNWMIMLKHGTTYARPSWRNTVRTFSTKARGVANDLRRDLISLECKSDSSYRNVKRAIRAIYAEDRVLVADNRSSSLVQPNPSSLDESTTLQANNGILQQFLALGQRLMATNLQGGPGVINIPPTATRTAQAQQARPPITCYACGQQGHLANRCPQPCG